MTTSAVLAKAPSSPVLSPWPCFQEDEIHAVCEVLRSGRVNYWTGEEGRKFEDEFASFTNCRHAIALANGTVALELALYSLGIGPGDEVITTSRTFIASASCAVMRGARPVLADVDIDSQNITSDTIRSALTCRTRAIIAVHLAGWPCDMDPILELAQEHGIKVIEDCAQAHGATYKGRPVGSMSHAAAFSFCQDKIMTTGGEGGMLTTNSERVWRAAWSFKDHGKNLDAVQSRGQAAGFRWLHESFGTNWRMTELQSAIGRIQVRKLPQWVAKRRDNAAILSEQLSGTPGLRIPIPPVNITHSYYKYYAFVVPEALRVGWNRDRVLYEVNARGVPCYSGTCSEIYLEKAFPVDLRPKQRLRTAKLLGETSLMFLVHPTLGTEDMLRTVETLRAVMIEACH